MITYEGQLTIEFLGDPPEGRASVNLEANRAWLRAVDAAQEALRARGFTLVRSGYGMKPSGVQQ